MFEPVPNWIPPPPPHHHHQHPHSVVIFFRFRLAVLFRYVEPRQTQWRPLADDECANTEPKKNMFFFLQESGRRRRGHDPPMGNVSLSLSLCACVGRMLWRVFTDRILSPRRLTLKRTMRCSTHRERARPSSPPTPPPPTVQRWNVSQWRRIRTPIGGRFIVVSLFFLDSDPRRKK